MRTRHYVIIGIAVVMIAATVYGVTRPQTKQAVNQARELIGYVQQIPQVLEALNHAEVLIVDEFKAELKRYQKETATQIRQLAAENQQLTTNIAVMTGYINKLTDSLAIYKPPDKPPGDFDECLQQIQVYAIRDSIQHITIVSLTAINTQQGIIIDNQATIIERQSEHIDTLHDLHKDFTRTATRRIIITQLAIEAAKIIIAVAL